MSPVVTLRILIALSVALSAAAIVLLAGAGLLSACGDAAGGATFLSLAGLSGTLALGSIAMLAVLHAAWAASHPTMYPRDGSR